MTDDEDSGQLDLFPDAVVMVEADGLVRAANTLARRLLRCDRVDLIGRHVSGVLRLQQPGGADWWSCAALPDADPALLPRIAEQRLRLLRRDGSAIHVTVTGLRTAGADGRTEVLTLALRRADRHGAEERRRSDLISTASHELRSPLTSVRGFTKTLLARWENFDDATRRQMVATIDEDADRVTRLLSSLLDVSRIDTGRLPLRRQIVDLTTVVEPLARRFEVEHPDRPLTVDVADGLPEVVVDRDRINQVFSNLLDNALKHGRGRVRIVVDADDDEVRCEVADEGGEIPAAELSRLFGRYYRMHDMRTTGLGLGLYISRGIVAAHGGRIWATSAPDDGTRFVFTLPLASAELAP